MQMWGDCTNYTDSGPGQESFFLSYQHYKETMFIEMMLFDDLLFMIFMYLKIMELVFFCRIFTELNYDIYRSFSS